MGLKGWEARVVDEKVRQVKAEEKADKEFWQAIAIGLGLLSAIPTGGAAMAGSVALAGLVAAAGSMGAAFSMQQMYEHYKDYKLGSAAAESSLDPAQSIAKDAPDLAWLAQDLLDLGLNVVGAGAAFKSLNEAVQLAKASKLSKLQGVIKTAEEVGLAAESQGRLLAHTIGQAGGANQVTATLGEIADVIKSARIPGQEKLTQGMHVIAVEAIAEGKVGSLTTRNTILMKQEIAAVVRANVKDPATAEKLIAEYTAKFRDRPGLQGAYNYEHDFILIRGDRSPQAVAATLVHETAHRQQQLLQGIENLCLYEVEFQAHVAQQQFLRGLPPGQVPVQYHELWKASVQDIETMVLTRYPTSFKPRHFNNEAAKDVILTIIRGAAR